MAIEFPPLPFAIDALEPHISKLTLEFHHGKHHKKYVDTLNELIKGTPMDKYPLEKIMTVSHLKKQKIYNNAAQAWNHEFMWNCLAKNGGAPSENLKKALTKKFGSMEDFKSDFLTAGKELFGSGWAWLVKDKHGKLQLRSLSNAENPMQKSDVPLLTCDVWEHAYYLDYQNERPKYLENYWSLINWKFVEDNLG